MDNQAGQYKDFQKMEVPLDTVHDVIAKYGNGIITQVKGFYVYEFTLQREQGGATQMRLYSVSPSLFDIVIHMT